MKYQALAIVGILSAMALVAWAGEPSLDSSQAPQRLASKRNEARFLDPASIMQRRCPTGHTEFKMLDNEWCTFKFEGHKYLFNWKSGLSRMD